MYDLTIISPFYNSEEKSHRLLSTLSKIKDKGIETIFVDDGSTDNTVSLLESFKQHSQIDVTIITQENKGPGGARNTGLKAAKGKYVWFVDSDDDIELNVIAEIKEYSKYDCDFIDFNYNTQGVNTNSMSITSGIYQINDINRQLLIDTFGRIVTKVIKRDFIIQNGVYYPEYCIYEDNPLAFIYPFLTNSFIKSESIAYLHNEDFPSVTRGKQSSRYFDRLHTSVYGFEKGKALANTHKEQSSLENKFISLYLINTVGGLISIKPSISWLSTHKVMKQFRVIDKELGIKQSYKKLLNQQSIKFKTYFLFHWYLSYLTHGNPSKFFEAQRLKAWNRPFNN